MRKIIFTALFASFLNFALAESTFNHSLEGEERKLDFSRVSNIRQFETEGFKVFVYSITTSDPRLPITTRITIFNAAPTETAPFSQTWDVDSSKGEVQVESVTKTSGANTNSQSDEVKVVFVKKDIDWSSKEDEAYKLRRLALVAETKAGVVSSSGYLYVVDETVKPNK
jgi:hypothetical protein